MVIVHIGHPRPDNQFNYAKNVTMKHLISLIGIFLICTNLFSMDGNWKAGVAKLNITPEYSMWLAGYGARTSPSDGTLHDIWAKALALEDAEGNRSVLVTSDLLGFPKGISDDIRAQLKQKLDLDKSQIILNSSHTHSAPVLSHALFDVYPLNEEELNKIEKYSDQLVIKMVGLITEAFDNLEKVRIYSENGQARFQVNRRNNSERTIIEQTHLNGPNDYAVPVIKVETEGGDLMAIAFGYACHPTVLGLNQWSGDYPGFAQIELEKDHPGTMALFFQGAGADQNPIPRRTVPLAKQYGRTLAAAVDRVLEEEMQELTPKLQTAYTEIDLNLNAPPSEQDLMKHCETAGGYQLRWGKRLLGELQSGKSFLDKYPYPLQVWKLGEQSIFTLGGELVVGYAIQLKKIFGHDVFVMGYSNDVMAYIPTAQILHEGGYEGASSQTVYGLPSTWAFDIETDIISNIVKLAKSIEMETPENPLIGN